VNKTNDDQLYSVLKEYSRDKHTGIVTLSLFDIKGDLIQQGIIKDGKYIAGKNPNHVSDSFNDSGETIVVITAPPVNTNPGNISPDFPTFPSDPSSPFTDGVSGSGSGGTSSNQSIITNQITNPCLSALVNNLVNANFKDKISEIISKLSTNTHINITFKDVFSNPDGKAANSFDIRYVPSSGNFTETVTLSTDLLSGTSKEYATAVIIHEIIHNYFSATANGQNVLNSHQMMADDYVAPMASYLNQLYPTLSIQNATALVWSGISDSKSYNDYSTFTYSGGSMSKQDLKDIYSNYVAKVYGTDICH
jgi:hypothetical protein